MIFEKQEDNMVWKLFEILFFLIYWSKLGKNRQSLFETFFGIKISKASKETKEIIRQGLEKERMLDQHGYYEPPEKKKKKIEDDIEIDRWYPEMDDGL